MGSVWARPWPRPRCAATSGFTSGSLGCKRSSTTFACSACPVREDTVMTGHRFDDDLLARVRANVNGFERRAIAPDGRRHAAVAVVLLPDEEGRACFLLTRRAATLNTHARQWALPGGRIDAGETPEGA